MRPSFSKILSWDAISSRAALIWACAISYILTLKPAEAKIIAYDRPIRPQFTYFTQVHVELFNFKFSPLTISFLGFGLLVTILNQIGVRVPYCPPYPTLERFSYRNQQRRRNPFSSILKRRKVWHCWTEYHVICSHCFISNDSKNWANFMVSINQFLWYFRLILAFLDLFVLQILLILRFVSVIYAHLATFSSRIEAILRAGWLAWFEWIIDQMIFKKDGSY